MTRAARALRIWITGGGTREPLDAVRWVGNVSTGRMAAALAREAARRGHRVTLFAAEHVAAPRSARIEVVRFVTSAQLRRALSAAGPPPDAILHAAAVSDYAPRPQAGKVRSGRRVWRVELVAQPKIAPELRRRHPDAALVLFKLEAGITRSELLARATSTARAAGADAIFANRLEEVGDAHRGWLIDAGGEGGPPRLAQGRSAAARLLVRRCEAIASARARAPAGELRR